ncbi:rab GTPase-binding effector protein 2 isoform X2 [Rhinatrema bivittatum]|uniref:rab GTPase-binding effector protein 2 isoform X2 n=1 Tax=Rhinatrema bivittatum TaxID=194408 RepID=UPI00112DD72C|nr:rab GTPase-binding effector protein 2 isoform X2 [Rhinatrema bivittatum]
MAAAAIPTSGEEQRQLQAEGEQVQQLQAQLQEALAEIENIKTVATVSESTKQEVIDEVKRRYQEEVASLQAITKDSIGSYEARIAALQREQIQYRELKERELSQLKKLASHAHPLESLEKQMEKAREDAEKLREIVLPMEQEISLLRKKLTRAEGLVLEFQAAKVKQQQVSLHQADERLEKAQREKKWLEEALQRSADDCASQVKVLLDQIQNSEQLLQNLQVTVSQTQDKTQQQLADLASSHKRLCYEVKCLSDENERLRGHPKPTVPREEEADGALPTSVSELQSMVQRYRQEIFTLQRGSDHQEERLRIEIVTLRDQLQSEQRLRKNLQEMMQTNLESQREETELLEARLSSVKSEMDRMEQERNELELRLQEAEAERESLLRDGKDKEMNFRETLKEEKNKVHRLQTELTTSEEVQRDFVRLSQTLQVSLEQIRQAESLEQVQRILEGTRVKDVSELKVT